MELAWTVLEFHNNMIEVKIAEMVFNNQLLIDPEDIVILTDVNDTRYIDEK